MYDVLVQSGRTSTVAEGCVLRKAWAVRIALSKDSDIWFGVNWGMDREAPGQICPGDNSLAEKHASRGSLE